MTPSKRTSSRTSDHETGRRAPLAEYQRKRDFDRTREPSGSGARQRRQGGLRFVIQKHAASSLHYDLRLELDGVMRSWAVPKGPSLDPSVKRLAMQVEDHPVEYNTFEGTIPRGEYGGGTVMLWDRGTYSPDEARKGEAAASAVRRGLAAGKLSFSLHGERLHGSFALVRTERGEKPKWLLIKHRDEQAADGAEITDEVLTSIASGRTMEEIAASNDRVWRSNRDGGEGGEEAVDEPPPGPASQQAVMIPPMLPKPVRSLPDAGEWTYEPWRGGDRVLAYVTSETALLMSDRATDITQRYRAVADELISLAGRIGRPFVLDGEVAAAPDGGDTKNKASRKPRGDPKRAGQSIFYASDLLLEGDQVLMDSPWSDRQAALKTLFRRRRLDKIAVQETASADAMLRRAARNGWPGIIARRADARYEPGTRSDALLRIAVV